MSTATLGSSGRGSAAGGFSGAGGGTGNLVESRTQELSPQQLGVMGMEALDTAIHYWDDSIGVFQSLPVGQAANHVMALPVRSILIVIHTAENSPHTVYARNKVAR